MKKIPTETSPPQNNLLIEVMCRMAGIQSHCEQSFRVRIVSLQIKREYLDISSGKKTPIYVCVNIPYLTLWTIQISCLVVI